MTDPQQAARIAAMRARRGQAPVEIPTRTASPVASWAPPTVADRFADTAEAHSMRPTVTLEMAVVQDAPAARQRASRPAPAEKGRHPHVAAGARILVTGLTASSIFGLTSVIASANRPIVPAADPSQVATAENTSPTTVPSTATIAPVVPAAPVPTVLTLPPAVSTVTSPQAAAQPATAASPAPAPAKAPAKAPATTQPPATTQAPPPPPATTKASG